MYTNNQNIDYPIFGKVYGGKLYFRGRSTDGEWVDTIITDWAPTYYTESKNQSDYIGLFNENLKPVNFQSIADANKWARDMKDCGVDVHGMISHEVKFFSELPKKKPVLPTELKTLYYDIETTVSPGENIRDMVENASQTITLISTFDTVTKACHLFMFREPDYDKVNDFADDITKQYKVEYHLFTSEKEMLQGFLVYYQTINPHCLSGWNTQGFDNVYVYNRLMKLFGEKTASRLSPFGMVKTRTIQNFGKDQTLVDFVGVADYDYLEIYKSYTYHSMSSYRLDAVASYELNATKLHFDGSFSDFYTNHWDMFVAYNIRDTLLVYEIDKATDLLSVAVSVSQMCGVNLSDTFGTIKKLDALFYGYAKTMNIIIPPEKYEEGQTFPGGFVSDPQIGRQYGVISCDAASLYPSLIRMFNISPECQVPYNRLPEPIQELCDSMDNDKFINGQIDTSALKGTPYCVTGAGVVYDQTKQGIAPKIMEDLFTGRKAAKKRSLEHKRNYHAAKIELEKRGIKV